MKTSVRRSVVIADTREGQVRVGVDVPSMRGETGPPLRSCRSAVVDCCQGGRFLTVRRCCAVTPVDMLAAEVLSIQTGNVGMAVGVSREHGGL